MIGRHRNGTLRLEFGTGDIGIHIGGSEGCGFLAFAGQEPRKPGMPEDWGSVKSVFPDEFPVSMAFTSVESVDVFIRTLAIAKKIMTGEIVLRTTEG